MSKMTPLELARKLGLPKEALEALQTLEISDQTAAKLKEAFQQGPKVFEIAARQEPDSDLLVLGLYLRWAMDAHFLYAIRGMSWDIFFDTFRDLTENARDFTEQTGKAGLKNWEWIGYAIKLELFRLGKLEFRPIVLKEEMSLGGEVYAPGTKVLEVYFPVGESLEGDAVEESLARGKEFFQRYYRQEYELFLCHSSVYRPV